MDNKTQERIKADAESYVQRTRGQQGRVETYIAGATAESEFTKKAMILLKIIVSRFKGAAEMADQDYDKGLLTKCRNLIEQWKGKEVEDVCTCSLSHLAAHGECYKCPGRHTRSNLTNPQK